jgi:ADP-ribosyl-[dinitrogen reductase] hydrolase
MSQAQLPAASFTDRIHGCLLGGAIGDAMGGPFEGMRGPLQYRDLSPWSISDDTQLTLATCESIIKIGLVSPEHIASRLSVWFREGRITGIGGSTLKALRDLDAGAHWALAGARGEMAAGNGAAMRIAPLAFFLDPRHDRDRQVIRDVCRITHHNDEAYAGALAIVAAIRAPSPEESLSHAITVLPDSRVRDRLIAVSRVDRDSSICDVAARFGASGYVVDSVPLAVYSAQARAKSPVIDVLREVIEAGGDTDTNASLTGQILGAGVGASNIPDELIQRLPDADALHQIATELARSLCQVDEHDHTVRELP